MAVAKKRVVKTRKYVKQSKYWKQFSKKKKAA